MKNNLLRLRIIGIIFIYILTAISTMVDKLTFINEWNLGIDQEYWESNGIFLASIAFWFNMLLYSFLPVVIATFSIKDKIVIYCSYALPVFWGFFLFSSVVNTNPGETTFIPNMKDFIYGILFTSALLMIIKLVIIVRSLSKERTIEELEKFKSRAMRKLSKVNPKLNQKLFEDVLGNHGEALNLLIAATYTDDVQEKQDLTHMALDYVASGEESLEKLQKRLALYANIDDTKENVR